MSDELKARKEAVWLNGMSEGLEPRDEVREVMEAKRHRMHAETNSLIYAVYKRATSDLGTPTD